MLICCRQNHLGSSLNGEANIAEHVQEVLLVNGGQAMADDPHVDAVLLCKVFYLPHEGSQFSSTGRLGMEALE